MPPDTSRDAPTPRSRPGASDCRIETFTLGPFETNCFIIYDRGSVATKDCWIVDASFEPGPLIQRIRELGLKPSKLILTHAHIDHIAGVDDVLRAFPGTPVLVHPAEKEWLSDPGLNLGRPIGMEITAHGPDALIEEGQTLELGPQRWLVLHTPGHSPGGISLYNQEAGVAIVGDSLFAGSIGRHDFPGSDIRTLAASIQKKLYALPDATTIFPGHMGTSTIGVEKRTNPFIRA